MAKPVPKYVLKMLQRRADLAMKLMDACSKVDEYCEKVGVDMDMFEENSIFTHVSIYCEPWNAYSNTLQAIEKALNGRR